METDAKDAKKADAAPHRPRYATADNPTVAAILDELFRFKEKAHAVAKIQALREHFTTSRHQPEDKEDTALLWIKGYGLTDKEEGRGYIGNYALIACKPVKDGRFTLYATKLESELKYHPQRKRPQHRHPNWGHPVLRAVKKKRIYPSAEEARAEIHLLHEEFPETTIPLQNKLYLMIYSRAHEGGRPVRKYVLEIQVAEEGGFYLRCEENDYKAPPTPKTEEADAPAEPPKGYFTSLVELKRRRPRRPIATAGGAAEEEA